MKATPSQVRLLKVNPKQSRLMRAAGFHLTDYGVKDAPAYVKSPNHMVQWARGDLRLAMMRSHVPTLLSFTDHLIHQVYYRTTRAARNPYPFGDGPCFPVTNGDQS